MNNDYSYRFIRIHVQIKDSLNFFPDCMHWENKLNFSWSFYRFDFWLLLLKCLNYFNCTFSLKKRKEICEIRCYKLVMEKILLKNSVMIERRNSYWSTWIHFSSSLWPLRCKYFYITFCPLYVYSLMADLL